MGARLLLFWEEWQEITNDRWVQGIAKEGLKLDLISHPIQTEWPRQIVMDKEMAEKCDQEVREMLVKQAIVPVSNPQGGFVSSLFAIPKKSGGFRPIVNLKRLNSLNTSISRWKASIQ